MPAGHASHFVSGGWQVSVTHRHSVGASKYPVQRYPGKHISSAGFASQSSAISAMLPLPQISMKLHWQSLQHVGLWYSPYFWMQPSALPSHSSPMLQSMTPLPQRVLEAEEELDAEDVLHSGCASRNS